MKEILDYCLETQKLNASAVEQSQNLLILVVVEHIALFEN
jgi:hypothetical protein